MNRHHLVMSVAMVGLTAAMIAVPAVSAAETPPMGGGYVDVMSIPARHSPSKSVAAALFKPDGAGRSRRSST